MRPRPPVQNADTAKQLTAKQQSQEEVTRVKEQLAFQVEQVKRESEMKVRPLGHRAHLGRPPAPPGSPLAPLSPCPAVPQPPCLPPFLAGGAE